MSELHNEFQASYMGYSMRPYSKKIREKEREGEGRKNKCICKYLFPNMVITTGSNDLNIWAITQPTTQVKNTESVGHWDGSAVKVLAASGEDLSSIPGTYLAEGKNSLP